MKPKIKRYKEEIAYLLTIMPRKRVKRILYDDRQKHHKLGITETTCDRIWTDLMMRKNPEDVIPKRRKVVVYYRKSHKLRGVYGNQRAAGRSIGISPSAVSTYIRGISKNAIYTFKEELI